MTISWPSHIKRVGLSFLGQLFDIYALPEQQPQQVCQNYRLLHRLAVVAAPNKKKERMMKFIRSFFLFTL